VARARARRAGGGGYRRSRPAAGRSGFEVFSWFFMRISGLLLIFLALYHLIWWNLVIGVEHLDSQVVIERWNNPLWRFFNVALVSFAMLHGLNGARYSIEDYVRNPGWQVAVKAIVYTIVLGAWRSGLRPAHLRPRLLLRGPMIHTHTYDALVVGGGGAGMMSAIYLSRESGLKTAVISKLYPTPLATPARRRAASAPRSATWRRTTRSGTPSTPSRAPTTSATRTRSR
jgi:succinate dehydrogenase / fumarate reductase, membrane anchor subunit